MGFEPTTFCMASSTWGRGLVTNCLQTGGFRFACGTGLVREFTAIHGDLGTEWGPGCGRRKATGRGMPRSRWGRWPSELLAGGRTAGRGPGGRGVRVPSLTSTQDEFVAKVELGLLDRGRPVAVAAGNGTGDLPDIEGLDGLDR
jgi:hypothetical protein